MKKRRILSLFLAFLLVLALLSPSAPVAASGGTDARKALATNDVTPADAERAYTELNDRLQELAEVYEKTGAYLAALEPATGSAGGEWLVLGLARGGAELADGYREAYADKARAFVKENCNGAGQLNGNKSTENSRMILALTSIGYSPEAFGGRNLLTGLSNMDYLKKQGLNGPIWALIALDAKDYEIPKLKGGGTQTTREGLIEEILNAQLGDGGFALSGESADADITGMALQALAPYYTVREDVKAAVDEALVRLSDMQLSTGGYASWGEENIESSVQVLVALSALGIDAESDERFVKNGNSLLGAILAFAMEDGSFSHEIGGETNQMATEQAYYALTAYYRMVNGETALYAMRDVEARFSFGDVNGDGTITAGDALAILKDMVGMEQEAFLAEAADCDGRTGITAGDALAVLKYMVGIVDALPVADSAAAF